MLKTTLAALAVAVMTGTAALAGGLAEPRIEPEVAVQVSPEQTDWTGFYAGIQVGSVNAESAALNLDETETTYGLIAGYRQSFDNFVLGAEVDVKRVDSTTTVPSLKLQAGYAFDRILPYATVGVAQIDVGLGNETETVYGLGADFALYDNITVGVEYLRANDVSATTVDLETVTARVAYRF